MVENLSNIFPGVYRKMLNFSFLESIKVRPYFEKNDLKMIDSKIQSSSDFPNQILSVIVDILESSENLIVGTVGLASDSVKSTIEKVVDVVNSTQSVIFVHTAPVERTQFMTVNDLTQLPNLS